MRGSNSNFSWAAGSILFVALVGLLVTHTIPSTPSLVVPQKIRLMATAVDAAMRQGDLAAKPNAEIGDDVDLGEAATIIIAKKRKLALSWALLEGCWEASPQVYRNSGNRHITCFRARERLNVVYLHYANRGYNPEPTDCSYASKVRMLSKTHMILEANMDHLGACSNTNAAGRRVGYSVELVTSTQLVDHTLTRLLLADGVIKGAEKITYTKIPESEAEVRNWFRRAPKPQVPIG